MIERIPELPCPDESETVWRFMDFAKFVNILDSGKLYFTQICQFDDKFEGINTRAYTERMRKWCEEKPENRKWELLSDMFGTFSKATRQTIYASCWNLSKYQSAALWKQYLKSDEGIAIKTTVGGLFKALQATTDVVIPAKVNYIDYDTDEFPTSNQFFWVTHKRHSFAHEQEFRLLWWTYQADNQTQILSEGHGEDYGLAGRKITADLEHLIPEVFVSPTSQEWFRETVEAVTKKYGLKCPVVKSDLYRDPVW